MQTIRATYRVVTPLSSSGADQAKAELRPPSFKGALRFWWRALAWERLRDVKRIRQEEAGLFGSAAQGQASFSLTLSSEALSEESCTGWPSSDPRAYGGYGLLETTKTRRRTFILPGSEFTALLCFRRSRLSSDRLQELINALTALGLLGGLGGRSRRGWGSLTLTDLADSHDGAWRHPATKVDFEERVRQLIEARGPQQASNRNAAPPPYTSFTPGASWATGTPVESAVEAHKELLERYREALKATPRDERAEFGLPRARRQERRASPVFLHLHWLSEQEFLPVALYLPAAFLPGESVAPGGGGAILNFLRALTEDGRR